MGTCPNCGEEVAEGADHCPACGTRLHGGTPPIMPPAKRPFWTGPVIALVVVTIVLVVAVPVLFLPIVEVEDSASATVPFQVVEGMDVSFEGDLADVDVVFAEMEGALLNVEVDMDGRRGLLSSEDVLVLVLEQELTDGILNVDVRVSAMADLTLFPWGNVDCQLTLDPAIVSDLRVETDVGTVRMSVPGAVEVGDLELRSSTGRVDLSLAEGATLGGDVALRTTTGDVDLDWNGVEVPGDMMVDADTDTGSIDLLIEQTNMTSDVTIDADTDTGSIDLTLRIADGVGAQISSDVDVGDIDVQRQEGFEGVDDFLRSENYPGEGSFIADLRTDTGEIDIEAEWEG